ncbi:MAG: sigma-54-dependent Fis family transcriptional regulator [Ignavibacteriales bacterium]|nr:sigma-54-dependent Fis family transcriptional regulator [Ignavibacteriales bacterium]
MEKRSGIKHQDDHQSSITGLILGNSDAIQAVRKRIEKLAGTNLRVLILGETGTGKELVAAALHRLSGRGQRSFVAVNCAAIPSELIESELFGHEKGSFSGATAQRIGKFEQADGGTLFLDEIGDMSLLAQAKVLRALEEGKIERVGGNKLISVDVWVIAATNRDLAQMVASGAFRDDLYYRLYGSSIEIPPLRHRREDVPLLADAFRKEACLQNNLGRRVFTAEAAQRLTLLEWPGNVRQLKNFVARAVIECDENVINVDQVEALVMKMNCKHQHHPQFGSATFEEVKRFHFTETLRTCNGNVAASARSLGVDEKTVRKHLRDVQLDLHR